jgi:dTMP kinase
LTQKDSELSDEAIHLLFSANRWEKVKEIKQSLKEGVTILCDRYAFSGICFSFIKGLNWEWCKSPDVGLPLPDLILFLSISPETARLRSGFGQERYETQEIQNEVRKVFERLKTQEFSDSDGSIWKEISAEGDITEVQERIRKQVEELFESEKFLKTSQEIGKLWVD